MGKVFRLHTNGFGTISHWQNSSPYGSSVIQNIEDPEGSTAKKEITSIPSPFARIDLVKTAFQQVSLLKDLDGNTIFHKMVSDTLDVAEIFFNIEKLSDKFEIISWDIQNSINSLISGSEGHQRVGATLKMFLGQDGADYNFNQASNIYLLRYKGGLMNSDCDIVGATSPATLFFCSANDLSYISNEVSFDGKDRPFDKDYQPLYKRDYEFIKYLFALKASYPSFATKFKEVNDYLSLTFSKLDASKKQEIGALSQTDITSYSELTFNANTVRILNDLSFHVRPVKAIASDFEIKPSHTSSNSAKLPLVLPIETGNTYIGLTYTYAMWDKDNQAPFFDNNAVSERCLPNEGSKHPYLTISDFLEDTIIKLDYKVNEKAFFNGNFNGNKYEGYLLPVKDLFFQYFTVDALMGNMPDGKPMIELQSGASSVSVILRIPIKGKGNVSYITYKRIFYNDNSADLSKNEGAVVEEEKLGMALYPGLKFDEDKEAFYRFATIGSFGKQYNTDFYYEEEKLQNIPCVVRNQQESDLEKIAISIIEKARITHCRIGINNVSGILIPRLARHSGSDTFTFAIDLGTTNTHIAYSVNNNPAKALDITKDDVQILYAEEKPDDFLKDLIDEDIMPQIIGEKYSFPTRTILSEGKLTNWNQDHYPLANTSVDFTYGRSTTNPYNKVTPDIKWANDAKAEAQIGSYIDSLMLIIRNKVLLNNGNLSTTKIVWTYPISMTRNKYSQLADLWNESFQKYISDNTANIIPMTESCAPYVFYKKAYGSVNRIVTIDIGGGTSDAVIAENGEVKYITSFRFAANTLFGSGYNGVMGSLNGIINKYQEQIKMVLRDNNLDNLDKILSEIENGRNSAEINAFFFSLADNAEIKQKNISKQISYNEMLRRDGGFKIVVLLFYSAIVYHIAQIMKAKGMEFPRHIAFSGNGSKAIQILTTDAENLAEYTKLLFAKVFDRPFSDKLEMMINQQNPKELTCNGGISSPEKQSYSDVASKKVVYKAAGEFISTEKYGDVDADLIDNVKIDVEDFFKTVFSLNDNYSFKDNFGVEDEALANAKAMAMDDATSYIKKGIEVKNPSSTDPIEETFFFNHLNGILFDMITNVVK